MFQLLLRVFFQPLVNSIAVYLVNLKYLCEPKIMIRLFFVRAELFIFKKISKTTNADYVRFKAKNFIIIHYNKMQALMKGNNNV